MLPELPDLEGVVGEVEVDGELLLAALAQRVLGQVGAAVEPSRRRVGGWVCFFGFTSWVSGFRVP